MKINALLSQNVCNRRAIWQIKNSGEIRPGAYQPEGVMPGQQPLQFNDVVSAVFRKDYLYPMTLCRHERAAIAARTVQRALALWGRGRRAQVN